MTERAHLSIREVLDLLVLEFPDVTISKIRFLESRGLIHPERTPSGYRKFYEPDVERLRWILRQQREHFLPLKVIKGRLDAASGIVEHDHVEASLFDGDCPEPPAEPAALVGAGTPPSATPPNGAASNGAASNGEPPKGPAGVVVPVGQLAVPASGVVSRPGALHAVAAGAAPASASRQPRAFSAASPRRAGDGVGKREGPAVVHVRAPGIASAAAAQLSHDGPPARGSSPAPVAVRAAPGAELARGAAPVAGRATGSLGARAEAPERGVQPLSSRPDAAPVAPGRSVMQGEDAGAKHAGARDAGAETAGARAESPRSADGTSERVAGGTGRSAQSGEPQQPAQRPASTSGRAGDGRPANGGDGGGQGHRSSARSRRGAPVPSTPSARAAPGVTASAAGVPAGAPSFSADELADAAGIGPEIVAELEEYGFVSSRLVAGVPCYGEEALAVARIAAGFRAYGIESRHLRTFKHAAEREAGLFSQVVTPLLRQRNPAAHERAQASLAELTELGAALHASLVRAELRDLVGG